MRLTKPQRRAALSLAELVAAGGEADRAGQELMALTLLDLRDGFLRMAPVYSAALALVRDDGTQDATQWARFKTLMLEAKQFEKDKE